MKKPDFLFMRGRIGLYAALKSLGIEKGDEVAIQAFTCVAVPEAVLAAGAIPIYIDISKNSVNMDWNDLQKKISSKTKAVIVQHTFGIPAEMDNITAVSKDIPIIEDCCHALFSKYHGKPVGSLGEAAFFSYEWGKPLVAGIGGGLIVNKQSLKETIKNYYNSTLYPPKPYQFKIKAQYIGYSIFYRPQWYWTIRNLYRSLGKRKILETNYKTIEEMKVTSKEYQWKMSRWQQKILQKKYTLAQKIENHSRTIAQKYKKITQKYNITIPIEPENCDTVYSRFPIFVENKYELLKEAEKSKIEMAAWYETPVHPLKEDNLREIYYEPGSCPNAEKITDKIITLPLNQYVNEKTVSKVDSFFQSYLGK